MERCEEGDERFLDKLFTWMYVHICNVCMCQKTPSNWSPIIVAEIENFNPIVYIIGSVTSL